MHVMNAFCNKLKGLGSGLWYLAQLSTISLLYRGRSVILVVKARVPGENNRPAANKT